MDQDQDQDGIMLERLDGFLREFAPVPTMVHLVTLVSFLEKRPMRTAFQYALGMGNPDRMLGEWQAVCDMLCKHDLLVPVPGRRPDSGTNSYVTSERGVRLLGDFDQAVPEEHRAVYNTRGACIMFRWRGGRPRANVDPHRYIPGLNDAPGDFERYMRPLLDAKFVAMESVGKNGPVYRVVPARYEEYARFVDDVLLDFNLLL
jgi:hypothetical protein